jgi:hypothetical protein
MMEEAENPSSPSIFVLVLESQWHDGPYFYPLLQILLPRHYQELAIQRSARVGDGRTSRKADPNRSKEKAF